MARAAQHFAMPILPASTLLSVHLGATSDRTSTPSTSESSVLCTKAKFKQPAATTAAYGPTARPIQLLPFDANIFFILHSNTARSSNSQAVALCKHAPVHATVTVVDTHVVTLIQLAPVSRPQDVYEGAASIERYSQVQKRQNRMEAG